MKKILLLTLTIILTCCSKAPINGDLDGLWQLTRIERLDADDNVIDEHCQKDIFWSFQLHLVQLGDNQFFGRFTNTGDSLRIYSLASASRQENESDNDHWLKEEDLPRIEPYGLYRLDTKFRIMQLDDEYMRLRSDDARLTFRKY